jgi:putative ABC transport system permease protein
LKEGNLSKAIQEVEITTKKFAPDYPFRFTFLDEQYRNLYLEEIKTAAVFKVFAVLAIVVSCLGLFGLATFTTEQKTKEIGIRKTLGSNIGSIIIMLSKQFTFWVLIANLIAWPITYYLINVWLRNFEYKINVDVLPFLLTGLFSLFIALITIAYKTIKAATANPIDSLRYE